jgi:hypothetical protein
MNKNDLCEIFSKFNQESVQKRKTVFKIAYLLAWNFGNKFKNNVKPNDSQNLLRKMLICGKQDMRNLKLLDY